MEIEFTVPGDPVPKGRPRFTRQGRAYTPKKTEDAEKAVKEIVAALDIVPFEKPVGIDLVFYCKTRRRTDGDNLTKLILDACNGLTYTDDYLVEEWHVRVYRAVPGEEPRTEVCIYPLEDVAVLGPDDLFDAAGSDELAAL